MTYSESHWAKLAISCWISSISSSESSKSVRDMTGQRRKGGPDGQERTDLFDCNYLFCLVVHCLVDGTEAACTEFVEQGVLTCGISAGKRDGLPGRTILAEPLRRMVEVSMT